MVTIGRVEAGSAANVIAERAVLEGTMRTTLPESGLRLAGGLARMARAVAELHPARIDVEVTEGYPPVINTESESRIAREAAMAIVGEAGIVAQDHPSMGSEDFSCYLRDIPGCLVRFGARAPGQEYIPLHSPAFDIDENVLMIGAPYFDAVARRAIDQLRGE